MSIEADLIPEKKLSNTTPLSKTSAYLSWVGMKQRCYYPNHKYFHLYGGRGIKVCDRWRDSSINFLKDMGEKPSLKHSIDRIDGDGDYTPENCRWATPNQQNINIRRVQSSGHPGVQEIKYKKGYSVWVARLMVGGKYVLYKQSRSLEEAMRFRKEAEEKYL